MILKRKKKFNFFGKERKIFQEIEKKKKRLFFSFDILESIRTFWDITTYKMFIFKIFDSGINL